MTGSAHREEAGGSSPSAGEMRRMQAWPELGGSPWVLGREGEKGAEDRGVGREEEVGGRCPGAVGGDRSGSGPAGRY